MFLHGRDVGERNGGRHSIKARETNSPAWVFDDIAVEVGQRTRRANQRRDILMPEQAGVSVVATRLIGKPVRLPSLGGRTKRIPLGAVNPDTDEVGKGLIRISGDLLHLRRWPARSRREDGWDVDADVLENGVGGRHRSDVAARAGEWYPWRRRVLAVG